MHLLIGVLSVFTGCTATLTSHDERAMLGELRQADRVHGETDTRLAKLLAAPHLDRGALIDAVLAANPDVEAMRQAWRAGVAEARAAGALDDPMLSYEFAPLSIASSAAPYGQRIQLRQKLPFPGKRGAARDISVAEAMIMRADFHAAQLMVAELASQLYGDAYLNARARELNDHHRRLVDQMKRVAEARIATGRGSTQDVLQAEVELGQLEHDLVMLETEQLTITARLDGLLHRDPDAPLPPPPTELTVPALPTGDRDALARPQQDAAEARLRAGLAKVTAAERAYYPDVELMVSYDSMWDMPEHRWMVGVGVELPLQRGKRGAELEAARARVAQARAQVSGTADAIRVEVVRAHRELAEGIHLVKIYDERLLPPARAQVDAALAGFTTGATDFPAVIAAERALREIQLAAARALAEAWRRRAALDRASGTLPGGAR